MEGWWSDVLVLMCSDGSEGMMRWGMAEVMGVADGSSIAELEE